MLKRLALRDRRRINEENKRHKHSQQDSANEISPGIFTWLVISPSKRKAAPRLGSGFSSTTYFGRRLMAKFVLPGSFLLQTPISTRTNKSRHCKAKRHEGCANQSCKQSKGQSVGCLRRFASRYAIIYYRNCIRLVVLNQISCNATIRSSCTKQRSILDNFKAPGILKRYATLRSYSLCNNINVTCKQLRTTDRDLSPGVCCIATCLS